MNNTYSLFVKKFIKCNTNEEINDLFSKCNFSEEQFYSMINIIDENYDDKILVVDILNSYKNYLENIRENNQLNSGKHASMFWNIYYSSLSPIEFCGKTGIKMVKVNSALKELKDTQKYSQMIAEIKKEMILIIETI